MEQQCFKRVTVGGSSRCSSISRSNRESKCKKLQRQQQQHRKVTGPTPHNLSKRALGCLRADVAIKRTTSRNLPGGQRAAMRRWSIWRGSVGSWSSQSSHLDNLEARKDSLQGVWALPEAAAGWICQLRASRLCHGRKSCACVSTVWRARLGQCCSARALHGC